MPAELEFQGDMTHDPTLGQALTVSVNGTGSNSGLLISHSSNIIVSGIAFQNFYMGLEVTDSSSEVSINRCKASGCGDSGFNLNTVSSATFNNCHAYGNTGHGFSYAFTCYGSMGGCITESNNNGLFFYWGSTLGLFSDIQVKNNSNGVLGRYNCAIAIGSRLINSGNSVNLNIGSGCSVY
jgi:hypothetical protein